MKRRTLHVAGSFARMVGLIFGGGLIVIAAAETINGLMCCWASERED